MKFVMNLSALEEICTENNNNRSVKYLFDTIKILHVWKHVKICLPCISQGPDDLNIVGGKWPQEQRS
jgi:hypothetical protein